MEVTQVAQGYRIVPIRVTTCKEALLLIAMTASMKMFVNPNGEIYTCYMKYRRTDHDDNARQNTSPLLFFALASACLQINERRSRDALHQVNGGGGDPEQSACAP